MYRVLFRVVLRRVPAETAHRAGFALIRVAGLPGIAGMLRRWLGPREPVLRVRALGLEFPGPLGLAAGFDKDARGAAGVGGLGVAAGGWGWWGWARCPRGPSRGTRGRGCSGCRPTGRWSTGWDSTTTGPRRRPPGCGGGARAGRAGGATSARPGRCPRRRRPRTTRTARGRWRTWPTTWWSM